MTQPDTGIRAWLDATSGIVVMLLGVQLLTGIFLAFYYVPSIDHAYTTVSFIERVVSSGSWLRSLHHYGSQWLSLFLFLHVVRLFWTREYVERNTFWIASVVLLGLVMAAGGTGYSLPWDARAFFSTRIAEGLAGGLPVAGGNARLWLLGGNQISTITLSRFFALHVIVIPALIVAVLAWKRIEWRNHQRNAIAAGVVFIALALWSSKFHAPLGPSTTEMTADYVPRPGAQFLWLYQSLKYVPGGLGSIVGLVLPGIALALLISLRWLRGGARLTGGVILGAGSLLIISMTAASYISDYRDPRVREQLARQAAAEKAMTFTPSVMNFSRQGPTDTTAAPTPYVKWCANCHGNNGEGAQQGPMRYPPLIGVGAKPRRTVDDIVGLLKDPEAYGLQAPMRSFSSRLPESAMKEIAEWVVKL